MEDKKPNRRKAQPTKEATQYSKEDATNIEKFVGLVRPTKEQMDQIFVLYNKFCEPKFFRYNERCSCENDIGTIYWRLMNWYRDNKALFNQEQ